MLKKNTFRDLHNRNTRFCVLRTDFGDIRYL